MAKNITITDLTDSQSIWLKALLIDAYYEAVGTSNNRHLSAMEAKTQEEVIKLGEEAKELRKYARILMEIADQI